MRLSVSGSVTSVNATCCRLLAVGARWAASTIIPSARSGTGNDVNARFERRERHSASICSGEGSPPRSTGCTFPSGKSPCRTEPVGQAATQCPQTMQVFGCCTPTGRFGAACVKMTDGHTRTHRPHRIQVSSSMLKDTSITILYQSQSSRINRMPPKSGTTKRNPFPTRSSEVEPEAAINGGPKPAVGS